MTWQIGSLVVLAAVLTGAFAWYERSRPPARVVALVAVLAALAAVSRIAFAPIPNVKPTTDIALVAGYVLGPLPGFAVGALAALASNLFFGQGPWTPWQMVAWGGAGAFGGVLALLWRRPLGRVGLAGACALAGAAFGAFMDVYQWTQGAEQDLPHYLAVSATSLPYNLAHVIGNVVFCLLAGPVLVRALRRYRRRLEVRWEPAAALGVVATVLAVGAIAPARASASASAPSRAAAYLLAAQNRDGGFGAAPGAGSSQLYTGWAALGLAAAGRSPAAPGRLVSSILDYVRAHAGSVTDTGELERTILVVRAAGASARAFAGRDLVAELLRRRSRAGAWAGSTNWTAFGVLALRSAGAAGAASSARWLVRHQERDGGFGFAPGSGSDVDDTGAVLEALGAAGLRSSAAARRGVTFLVRAQNRDGGFGQYPGDASNAQSSAWAVQGLVAAGRDPDRVARRGRTPLAFLRALQRADGSVRYSRSSAQTPVWVTAQALDALRRAAFPLRPAAAAPGRASAAATRAGAAHARSTAAGVAAKPRTAERGRRGSGPGARADRRATKSSAAPPPAPGVAPRLARAAVRRSTGTPHWLLAALAAGVLAALLGAGRAARRHRRAQRVVS